MIKKILATMILAVGLSVNACWFTAVNYDKCYIARINTTSVYDDSRANVLYRVSYRGGTSLWDGIYYRVTATQYALDIAPDVGNTTYLNKLESGLWVLADWNNTVYGLDDSLNSTAIFPPTGLYNPETSYWENGFNVELYGAVQPPAGTQDLPCQVWVKIAPRTAETGFDAPAPISTAMLQYKKLPSGTWTTFKTLTTINWTMDFNKPVQLFGPNIFDPPTATTGDEYLVRLYFTDGIYENADLGVNAPEGGDTAWRNQWVTKITISGKRRPQ